MRFLFFFRILHLLQTEHGFSPQNIILTSNVSVYLDSSVVSWVLLSLTLSVATESKVTSAGSHFSELFKMQM